MDIDDVDNILTKGRDFAQEGISGLTVYSGNVLEEFLPALRGPKMFQVYKEMSRNDPVVGAILLASKQLIRRASWRVETSGTSNKDLEAKEFLQTCIDDMSHTWSDMISDILSMLIYGWSYHEIVYKRREGARSRTSVSSMFNDYRIGWAKIEGRAQETTYEWKFNDFLELEGLYQVAPPDYQIRYIPFSKSLLFRTDSTKTNPEGYSLLRNAYRPWFFKKRIEEIEGIGIERDLAGLPVLTTPDGLNIWNSRDSEMTKVKAAAERLVRNVRRDQNEGIVLPFGWKLELLGSASRRQFDTNEIINRYDQRIAICMLADIIMMGSDKVGSFALGEVKKGLFAAGLEIFLDSIADVFNRYAIPRLFEINAFPADIKLPVLVHGQVESPDLRELARYIDILSDKGIPLFDEKTIEHLREIASLPITRT